MLALPLAEGLASAFAEVELVNNGLETTLTLSVSQVTPWETRTLALAAEVRSSLASTCPEIKTTTETVKAEERPFEFVDVAVITCDPPDNPE